MVSLTGPQAAPIYDEIGNGYSRHRRPDTRIAAAIQGALGEAWDIVNVGAGAGSYEPRSGNIISVEPSWKMICQRPQHSAPVVQASAECLPFADASFDAAQGNRLKACAVFSGFGM